VALMLKHTQELAPGYLTPNIPENIYETTVGNIKC